MEPLRRLVLAAVCAGAVAGGFLFLLQHLTVEPLIVLAESYEHQAADEHDKGDAAAWEPAGLERTAFTAIGTVLTGIAFAAILLGTAVAFGVTLDAKRGLVLGLIGFAAFVAAPSIGLAPKPPGVPGADVVDAQIWWSLTALSTLAGLGAIVRAPRTGLSWFIGIALVALPHVIGAPPAQAAEHVPADLVTRFAWLSVVTRLPFWLVLGALGGALLRDFNPDRKAVQDATL